MEKNGYVGFDFQVFDIGQTSTFVFSDSAFSYEKIERLLFFERKIHPLFYERTSFFLSKKDQRGGVNFEIFMETNSHHINNMQAAFRGKAECRWIKVRGDASTLYTLTEKKRRYGERWNYYYSNILTGERAHLIKIFLQRFFKEIKK